jgi:hypothetical protein
MPVNTEDSKLGKVVFAWSLEAKLVSVGGGDSINDGTFSTLNGNDRWRNELSVRLHQAYGNEVLVVYAGILARAWRSCSGIPAKLNIYEPRQPL